MGSCDRQRRKKRRRAKSTGQKWGGEHETLRSHVCIPTLFDVISICVGGGQNSFTLRDQLQPKRGFCEWELGLSFKRCPSDNDKDRDCCCRCPRGDYELAVYPRQARPQCMHKYKHLATCRMPNRLFANTSGVELPPHGHGRGSWWRSGLRPSEISTRSRLRTRFLVRPPEPTVIHRAIVGSYQEARDHVAQRDRCARQNKL